MTTPIKLDRVFALKKWSKWDNPKDFQIGEAHEVDVLTDFSLINHWAENGCTVERWTKAFQSIYGVGVDICKTRDLPTADHRIIFILNLSPSVRILPGWRTPQYSDTSFGILTNCQNFLYMWLVHPETLFAPLSDSLELYRKTLGLFAGFCEAK